MLNRRAPVDRPGSCRERIPFTDLHVPRFVSAHVINDAEARMLCHALGRDTVGNPRWGFSSYRRLAAALCVGDLKCDPFIVRWMPSVSDATATTQKFLASRVGHQGTEHCQLRMGAAGYLATIEPNAKIEAERRRVGAFCSVQPDLHMDAGKYGVIIAEVGAVNGDGFTSLLLPGPGVRNAERAAKVKYAVVLPFPGRMKASARGYLFRLPDVPTLPTPTRAALRAGWNSIPERIFRPTT